MPADTLGQVLITSAQRHGPKAALMERRCDAFEPISYAELAAKARAAAGGLREAGVRPGETVAILSENRPEWAYVDWGAQLAGVVTVPIYPTLTPPQIAYILRNSGVRLVFCEDKKLHTRAAEAVADFPAPPEILTFDPVEGVRGLDDFLAAPLDTPHPAQPDDTCTIIYTSGTTGDPKGVMLTHRNFLSNITAALEAFHITEEARFLSFLPLSHVFERMAGHFLPVYLGATIAYARSLRTLQQDIVLAQPTVMLVVPRFLEQVRSRIESAAASGPAAQRRLFRWAREVGRGRGVGARIQAALASALVGRKVRTRFGGRLRLIIAGGAALPDETATFYQTFGITVLQGYGLTETSPVIAVNPLEANRVGTVGRPLPGVEVRIAEDGEILTRGPHVMKGYHNLPDATREAIDADGWFHTGDIGELDEDGYLRITDRKKDLLVLANGKNVAPQPIEKLLASCTLIDSAVVLGDGMTAVCALIVPSFDSLRDALGKKAPAEELASDPQAREAIRAQMDAVLAGLADYERVKRFALLDKPFTIEGGELTPTQKIRRKVVREKYADLIADLARE